MVFDRLIIRACTLKVLEQTITAVAKLALHQSQRCQSIPTLSVLMGGTMEARHLWIRWLSEADRQTAICVYESQMDLFEEWISKIVAHDNLPSLALKKVANLVNQPTDQLAAWLSNTSEYQVELFWQRLFAIAATGPILRWLVEQLSLSETRSSASIKVSASWLETSDLAAIIQGFTTVMQLLPPQSAPGILIWLPDYDGASAAVTILASLTQLAEAVPNLPLGLVLTTAQGNLLLNQLPESKAKAILRSGLITLAPPESNDLKQWLSDRGVKDKTRLQTVVRWAELHSTTPEFLEAALSLSNQAELPDTAEADTVYRSQAEWFLFQCLEARPNTVRKFQVNTRLNICFGNRQMEVDFLAAEAKIVIELDGPYHFGSLENYRRDRRKDFLLQQKGFLVLRFLAEDVVAQLETILSTIDQALALRQAQSLNRSEA